MNNHQKGSMPVVILFFIIFVMISIFAIAVKPSQSVSTNTSKPESVYYNNTNIACSNEYNPVCGSNGLTYTNTCYMNMNGVSIGHMGACNTNSVQYTPSPVQNYSSPVNTPLVNQANTVYMPPVNQDSNINKNTCVSYGGTWGPYLGTFVDVYKEGCTGKK